MKLFIKIAVVVASLISSMPVSAKHISKLDADGPNKGLSAYQLIRAFAGKNPIESPDLYSGNHPNFQHIYEDTDNIVGHHFVFVLHRDLDKDRDKYIEFNDRQRNEIKAYKGSSNKLKGFEGDTLTYKWKFKVEPDMSLSKNFSHFFQLKSVDDGIGMPILTISGRTYKGQNWLALSHAAVKKSTILDKKPWQDVSGEWLEAECTVTYSDHGNLSLTVKRMSDKHTIFNYESNSIDMWRGTKKEHFVRPKWGFYRSLKSKEMLASEEDSIRFANFEVVK